MNATPWFPNCDPATSWSNVTPLRAGPRLIDHRTAFDGVSSNGSFMRVDPTYRLEGEHDEASIAASQRSVHGTDCSVFGVCSRLQGCVDRISSTSYAAEYQPPSRWTPSRHRALGDEEAPGLLEEEEGEEEDPHNQPYPLPDPQAERDEDGVVYTFTSSSGSTPLSSSSAANKGVRGFSERRGASSSPSRSHRDHRTMALAPGEETTHSANARAKSNNCCGGGDFFTVKRKYFRSPTEERHHQECKLTSVPSSHFVPSSHLAYRGVQGVVSPKDIRYTPVGTLRFSPHSDGKAVQPCSHSHYPDYRQRSSEMDPQRRAEGEVDTEQVGEVEVPSSFDDDDIHTLSSTGSGGRNQSLTRSGPPSEGRQAHRPLEWCRGGRLFHHSMETNALYRHHALPLKPTYGALVSTMQYDYHSTA